MAYALRACVRARTHARARTCTHARTHACRHAQTGRQGFGGLAHSLWWSKEAHPRWGGARRAQTGAHSVLKESQSIGSPAIGRQRLFNPSKNLIPVVCLTNPKRDRSPVQRALSTQRAIASTGASAYSRAGRPARPPARACDGAAPARWWHIERPVASACVRASAAPRACERLRGRAR